MANEIENKEQQQKEESLAEEKTLLNEYEKLKANSVSKEKYEADLKELKDKNALYLKAITEGGKVDIPADKDSGSVVDAIADISKFKGTNLEYWAKLTPAIDKMLKSLPEEEITKVAGVEGLEEIIKVNEGMKKLVEEANGDPDYFRTLYNNKVKDSAPRISNEIDKAGGLVNYLQKQEK